MGVEIVLFQVSCKGEWRVGVSWKGQVGRNAWHSAGTQCAPLCLVTEQRVLVLCLSVRAAPEKPQTRWLVKDRHLLAPSSGGWEAGVVLPAGLGFGEHPLPPCRQLTPCVLEWEKPKASSLAVSCEGTNPIYGAPAS